MNTEKLDKLAELLLDTGKRNNLINFRDTKTGTVEVLLPAVDVLFEKIDSDTTFEVYDPKITEEDETEDALETGKIQIKKEETDEKSAYLAEYSPKIKKQSLILLYNAAANPITALKNIDKKTREFMEETGVNVAYMAFGFINWKESESSEVIYSAPILLVPVQFSQSSAVEPYYIKSAGDDIIVNPTFAYKLDAEFGIKLPEYNDEGLTEYLEKIKKIVEKLQWSVSSECKIGIFSFLKINMYRDLKDNKEIIFANKNVRQILGEPDNSYPESENVNNTEELLTDLHSVVDADSSQVEAIKMAKSGKSFVLQGPPGTGKSQTITNIIAECLSDGKKVLFVSEKLAALNVVYDKLKNVGLSEFCLQLHSHKANKKDIIADICHTLRTNKSTVSSKADSEIAIKEQVQKQLDEYAAELHKQHPVIEKSLFELYEDFSSVRSAPDVEWAIPQLTEKGERYLAEAVRLLEQYTEYIPSVGYNYKNNPWYGYINGATSYQTKTDVKNNLTATVKLMHCMQPILYEISEKYGMPCTNIETAHFCNSFFRFAADSQIITPSLLKKDNFDITYSTLKNLQIQGNGILSSKSVIEEEYDEDIYKINGSEYNKKLTREFSGVFSRLFGSEYRQMIKSLRLCRKSGKKPSYSEAVEITQKLADYQQKQEEFAKTEAPIKSLVGSGYNGVQTDWTYVINQMNILKAMLSRGISFGKLPEYADFEPERSNFSDYAERLDQTFSSCDEAALDNAAVYFDSSVFNIFTDDCSRVQMKCNDCLNVFDKLDNWSHFAALLSELEQMQVTPYIEVAVGRNVPEKFIVNSFRKQFYFQWIHRILSESPVVSAADRISQDKAVRTFSEKDKEQFEINKARIRAELSEKRPSLSMIAPGSAVSVLLREGEKKRKQKSIRTLLAETGELVQCIKPCFLMSPLSVSTFLASDSVRFDVVIFDEASQIFPQDAIGAIYRAEQLIVVGDSKQMPPSNFFNATVEENDDGEETEEIKDFESILDLCSTFMQQLRLRWHYRSRYEQLITFSNKNFYDNDLVTFPSSKTDADGIGVDYYHVDGVFDRKSHTNRKEAEFIVDLIYKNIEKYPDRSLGVVAFSVAQQNLIDKLLSRRRQSMPDKEYFFKDDRREPFFIKNLETVQGDERDTIIFSVAYGIDAQGKLLHNFGPLNRVGGERRLNVAVTRAKDNIQLVSSMHYSDIDLGRTSAEGARLLREYLDYAENGDIALKRDEGVNDYDKLESYFETEVCELLRKYNYSVDTQVGCSGFKIDIALKKPDSSDYVLAIECDGADYHSSKNARDRDRLRQEILERMGWKFYRIWSTDWFRNRNGEQMRLLEAAAEVIQNPAEGKAVPIEEVSADVESFEETAGEKRFSFPPYRAADIENLSRKYLPKNFRGMVKEILEVEAPLSEDFLLKRTVQYFDREKVTNVVEQRYEEIMKGCETDGIIRRSGFLYLNNDSADKIQFRCEGDIEREIKQIAPEELGAGMLEIIKQNVSIDKNSLYRYLGSQCGISRVTKAAGEYFDTALGTIENFIEINDGQIVLK